MARTQVGIRITDEAVARIDVLANEYNSTRTDVLRILLSEALASQAIVTATRQRLEKAL